MRTHPPGTTPSALISSAYLPKCLILMCDAKWMSRANDVGYIATIQMGTPPRDFKLLMDSGSADLWVGAENCQSESGGGCVRYLVDIRSRWLS